MILVRVGQHEADEVFPLLLDEAQIRQHDVDARLALVRKGDAEVDHQPLARVRRTEAVEIDVHADLAEAAERHEHEFVCRRLVSSRAGCAISSWSPIWHAVLAARA